MPQIEYGEWLPDLPSLNNPGCTVAKNVIPANQSYEPMPSQSVFSNALDTTCIGAFSTRDADGNTVNFAGTATKLYRLTAGSYADVSIVGGYTTPADDRWHFTRFDNRLIATNFGDSIQTFTVNSGSNFANLSAGAPKARYIANVDNNFVMVGNTYDAVDGNMPHRVRWCAFGDPTDWTVSATTQADYNDLNVSNGWVRGIVPGKFATIFQERAIVRADPVGSPIVFQFTEIESEAGKGTNIPGSIIKVGNISFYLGQDGFYAFDGNQSISIGAGKVDKTIWSEIDATNLDNVFSTAYPDRQFILWAIPATGNTSGRCNRIYIFNYASSALKRWSRIEDIDIELIFNYLSEGYTLDTLDTLTTNIDTFTTSLDDRSLTGQNMILSGFDSSHRQVTFSGPSMDAVLETQEVQFNPRGLSELKLVRPLVEGSGTVTIQDGTRHKQSDSVSYGTAASVNTTGDCELT
jgi:hypothetical protein